jgi:type IV pilus assembly protein PilW
MKTPSIPLRQTGLSLIELMVAIAIGLFLLAGAVTIFSTSKRTYVEQEDSARIQENLRFALEAISRDLRMAGYFGCGHSLDPERLTNVGGPTDGTLRDTSVGGLEGLEGSEATPSWLPSGNTSDVTASVLAGTDGITIRHAGGPAWEITGEFSENGPLLVDNKNVRYVATNAYSPNNQGVTYGGDGESIQANDLVVVSGCGNVDLFQAGSASATQVALSTGSRLSSGYNSTAKVSKATLVRYFISTYTDSYGEQQTGLFRQYWDRASATVKTDTDAAGNAIPLVANVENMQITYGIDNNNDDVIDSFVAANSVTDWSSVLAVKLGLLGRSARNNAPEADTKTYTVNGTTVAAANDNRKRRIMETTVFIRNNSITIDRI